MSTSTSTASVLRFGLFDLDVRAGELRKSGMKLRLQGQPLQVLAILLEHAGELVTREELRSQIWTADTFVDFDHSLHNAVARLREVLGDSAETPRYIETLPRRGYRFIAQVGATNVDDSGRRVSLRAADARQIRSIAVLCLEDLSGDSSHDYFADGMTEALITSLAKIKALRVISRTSAMQYKGVRKSLPQIARELNVDSVIEGSVLRCGDRIRITAQLIHASNDEHLWAESYERDFRDILSLQSEIARQVADKVKIILTPEEHASLGKNRQVNPEAHELYLKARYHWNKRSEEGVRKALSYFRRAIDFDPTDAQAHAGLADVYNILGYYNSLPPMEAYAEAKASALKALQLDNSLAEPHATLGVIKRDFEWDWAGAEEEFQRAIEISPGFAEAYHWNSTLLSMMGKHSEALHEKRRALALDPLSVVIRSDLGRMFYFSGDYDRALEQYRAALDMDPNFGSAHLWLANVYEQKGQFEDALAELQTGMRLSSDSTYALAKWGHACGVAGKADEARAALHQLHERSKQKYVSPYDISMVHLGLNELDEAFAWLENLRRSIDLVGLFERRTTVG